MQSPRIVHLISSLKIGGAESWLLDLIANLPKSYRHEVIFFHDGPNRELLNAQGIPTHHIPPRFYSPLFYCKVLKLLKTINPDLVHSSLWSANFAARICAQALKKPLISSIHLGLDEDGLIRNLLDRFTFQYADHVVAVSGVVGATLQQRLSWLKQTPYSVIRNGISAYKPHKSLTRAQLGLKKDAFVIGSVGRFIPRKNYAWLLACFKDIYARYPNAHLLLLGLGPEEAALRALVADYGLAHAATFVIGQQALPYYALMDCFIQPSKQEGLSIALLEAMSAGLPCIATSPNGAHDALNNGINGIVIPLEKEAVIQECAHLIEDHALRAALAQNALASIETDYSSTAMAAKYDELYKKYIKNTAF